MNDPNNKRLLMAKLNAIEGVEIAVDQLDRRPSFDFLLLRGEGLEEFKGAFGSVALPKNDIYQCY